MSLRDADFFVRQSAGVKAPQISVDKVFIEDRTKVSDNPGILPGKFVRVDRQFIREYTDKGFTKIISLAPEVI